MKLTQNARTGAPGSLWNALASLRLSVVLLAALILLCLLGTLIAQEPTSAVPLEKLYSPDNLYLMKVLGFTDIFRSYWFFSVIALAALNLFAAVIQRFPAVWKQVAHKIPAAVNQEAIVNAKKHEKHVFATFQSQIGREQFRELAQSWCKKKVGKPFAVRDEGGFNELQIVAQQGRFVRLATYVAHVALVIVLGGALESWLHRFEARVDVEEGGKVDYVEITKGKRKWEPLLRSGRPLEGFFRPGFEIECPNFQLSFYPGTNRVREERSRVNILEGGKLAKSMELSVNHSDVYQGMRFYQAGYTAMNQPALVLHALDRKEENQLRLPSMFKSAVYRGEGYELKILDVDMSVKEMGTSVQLQYTEDGKPPETFWVFENYPSYDAVKRKGSRFVFTLASVKEKYATSLLIVQDPGLPWIAAGTALLILSLFFSLYFSLNRYWFIWTPGSVTVIGWSSKLSLFEPKFEKSIEKFRQRVAKVSGGTR